MNCLSGLVGISGPGLSASISGLYVNSLPGITLKTFDKTANEEQQTFFGVWKDIENRAALKLFSNINTEMSSRYKIKSITRSLNLGQILTTPQRVWPSTAQLRGFSCELRLASWYKPSSLQAMSVQSLSLYLLAPQDSVSIKLIDIETNTILDTFTITDGVIGWNTVPVNKLYNVMRLFVAYDATGIDAPDMQILNPIGTAAQVALGDIYGYGNAAGYIRGAESINPNEYAAAGLNYAFNTFGLSAIFSLVCKWDNFICNNKQAWALPLWYLLGSELMVQALATSRFNWITMDRDKLMELKNYFDGEYKKELDNVLRGLSMDTSDYCLECNAPVQIHEARM